MLSLLKTSARSEQETTASAKRTGRAVLTTAQCDPAGCRLRAVNEFAYPGLSLIFTHEVR